MSVPLESSPPIFGKMNRFWLTSEICATWSRTAPECHEHFIGCVPTLAPVVGSGKGDPTCRYRRDEMIFLSWILAFLGAALATILARVVIFGGRLPTLDTYRAERANRTELWPNTLFMCLSFMYVPHVFLFLVHHQPSLWMGRRRPSGRCVERHKGGRRPGRRQFPRGREGRQMRCREARQERAHWRARGQWGQERGVAATPL